MAPKRNDLWSELRRRHVVRTAAGYAAVAFVLLQLAEILFPSFGLSDAAIRALVAVVIAGFPVTLALSWIYDVRGGGLHRTPSAGEAGEAGKVAEVGEVGASDLGDVPATSLLAVGGLLFTAAAIGFVALYGVLRFDPDAAPPPAGHRSIAVLPFADMSPDGDQSYLGDGLAEEVLNILSGVDSLKVAARTSSFAFRGGPEDAREIGRRLGVSTFLEGSVRRDGSQVRVTAQLIETETGFHLWSANFDRQVDDLFAVQDEIAAAIVEELLGTLNVGGAGQSRHAPPQEAVDAYWKGRAEWNRRGAAGIPGAISLFNTAVEVDSAYAQAYAGLADSYALLPQVVPSTNADEAWETAEEYARTAISLDSELAEPHASLGLVQALRGERSQALVSLARAIDINPSYASAYHWRANVLAEMGQLGAALEDGEIASSLDPLSVAIATDYGFILLWAGRAEEAASQFQKALRTDFGYARARFGSALVSLAEGEPISVQMEMVQWAAVSGLPTTLAQEVAGGMLSYQGTGQGGSSPTSLAALVAAQELSAGTAAALSALVGARDEAVRWLERAVEDRSWVDQFLMVNTIYDPLRSDPGFQEVLARVTAL